MKNRHKLYKNEDWFNFREQVIELDGCKCTRCEKKREEGAILQVHHKEYIKGTKLWEYPLNLCETLCKGCHAAEHGIIRPEIGWEYVGEDDLGDLDGSCDRCGTSIRYVFYVQHPHWEPMTVGTVCCDDLTGTKIASDLRKQKERLKRFLVSKRWEDIDGSCCIRHRRKEIKIFPHGDGFKISIDKTDGRHLYETIESAKERVFKFFDTGEAEEFFKKQSQ